MMLVGMGMGWELGDLGYLFISFVIMGKLVLFFFGFSVIKLDS